MQKRQAMWQHVIIRNMYVLLIMSCIIFLLSGCSEVGISLGNSPQSTPTHPKSTGAPQLAQPKSDASVVQTEEPYRVRLAKVLKMTQDMSLDQKLGQLLLVEYLGKSYQTSGLQMMIKEQFVGGFIYQESNHNFDTPYNVATSVNTLSRQAMHDAQIPLIIAMDQEGGLVNRLYKFHGPLPSAQDMAASGNPQIAFEQGKQSAKWMLDLGVNTDLAPVVDVHTVDPPVLVTRMFGRDPQLVATYAGAFLDGLQQNGVIGCLKHFPGLGAVSIDPHAGLPTVNRSITDLNRIDLAPYKALIQQKQPAMIMATDVLMPAIDPALPAELSPKTVTGVLRGELGYTGVVITDSLYMGGISAHWSLSQAAVLAIIAGNDLVEGAFSPNQVAGVIAALKQTIQQGRLSQERIDQSVKRILLMKMQYGLIK